MSQTKKSYSERSKTHPAAIGRRLLAIMAAKQSNLCISVDLTSPSQILALIDELGPKVCLVKTHIDIITFTTPDSITAFTTSLQSLATHHNFLIFEDRKFADIGSTVQHQYRGGIYRIASWAHITNAHAIPGEGIIQGLRAVAHEHPDVDRGLLMLGEMSSKGSLGGGEYLAKTVAMARGYADFVVGFIAQGAVERAGEGEDFVVMTPGVKLERGGDGLGQQYNTPDDVVGERGSDVIIVGRGIIKAQDPVEEAEKYRRAGWEAYERRLAN
ncbi:orotidine 5'-phosphate decarboxylase [Maublancomyces gigas]|uniref:Orotidine 5'-phosphate decarboxylase n=1 Tax=Discina gigas TaxID=1032678 RepID=A0ABR3GK12_9PEZI